MQGIDWLTQPEDLVTAVPNFPKVRELNLTEARSRYMLFLTAGVDPGTVRDRRRACLGAAAEPVSRLAHAARDAPAVQVVGATARSGRGRRA